MIDDIHNCGACGLPNDTHGESGLCREATGSLLARLKAAEAERDEQTEHADTLKRSDRQSLADYRKLRAQLDAAVERAEQAEADLTAARALLRECLEGREDCDDLTCSTTNRCEFCDLSARIEAHIGRDK